MLLLPRTLAAIRQPPHELAEVVLAEVPASRWPLEAFLTHGGWPEGPRVRIRECREHTDGWEILLTLEFTELCPAACPASSRPETRIGYVTLSISKSDGVSRIVADR